MSNDINKPLFCLDPIQLSEEISIQDRNQTVENSNLESTAEAETVVVMSRYYAAVKRNANSKERVSYFVRKHGESVAKIALFEYQGQQPISSESPGNAHDGIGFTRTNPKTVDEIRKKIDNKKPKEIFADLKRADSLDGVRDFKVIKNKKYMGKK